MLTSGITVVLPVQNEVSIIADSVRGIVSQFQESDELLIINAGSSDGTSEILRDMVLRDGRIRLIEKSEMYPGIARNIGAQTATNETLFFLDAGHDLAPNLLERLRLSISKERFDFVFVNRLLLDTGPLWYQANALLFEPIGVQENGHYYRHPKVSGMLTSKMQFSKVGPFMGWRSGEDREFLERIGKGSFSVLNCSSCHMYAQPDRSPLYSWRKKLSYSLDKQNRGIQFYQLKSLLFPSFLILSCFLPIGIYLHVLFVTIFAGFYYFMRVANRVRKIKKVPENDYSRSLRVVVFATIWLCLSDLAVSIGLVLSICRKVISRISL